MPNRGTDEAVRTQGRCPRGQGQARDPAQAKTKHIHQDDVYPRHDVGISRVLDLTHRSRTHHFNGKIATSPISYLIAIIDDDPALCGIIDAVNTQMFC